MCRIPFALPVVVVSSSSLFAVSAGVCGVDPVADYHRAWKQVEELQVKLDGLMKEFRSASTSDFRRLVIRSRSRAMQRSYDTAWEEVVRTFPPAYDKAPQDELVRRNLARMLAVLTQYHRFEDARRIAEALIEDRSYLHVAYQAAATAYYSEHRFQKAARYFLKAREVGAGRLDSSYGHFEKATADSLPYWSKERELRGKEKEADDLPRVLLKTSRGEIRVELFENEAPGTVANFIHLVERGFYDGLAFHRAEPLSIVQCGDPNTRDDDPDNDGQGGPGYTIPCECTAKSARRHFSGSLSMAHEGRDTGGSQFFITQVPTAHLNGVHTVFGRVLDGLAVLRGLKKGDTILAAKVLRKRDHEYVPVKSAPKSPSRPKKRSSK